MKEKNCEGYTLMETLVTVSLILISSFCIITAFVNSSRANARSTEALKICNTILELDSFIREKADSLHVSYWLNPDDFIEEFKNELWRTKARKYIKTITVIYDGSLSPSGVTVEYRAGNKLIKTSALFPFTQVQERGR